MKPITAFFLLITLMILIVGCVHTSSEHNVVQPVGISGSGLQADEGLGGTGKQADKGFGGTGKQADKGFGGTGKQADKGFGGTGIVGTITQFGSIWVNGLEVHYNAKTPVKINGKPAQAKNLELGQIVVVFTRQKTGDQTLQAGLIVILNALRGPITEVGPKPNQIKILNIPVTLDLATPQTTRKLQKGDFVAVSGHWKIDGSVRATHLRFVDNDNRVQVVGLVSKAQGDQMTVSGVTVNTRQSNIKATAASGRTVVVFGTRQGNTIIADKVKINPLTPFGKKAARLALEGYIQEVHADGSFRMLGTTQVTPNAQTQFTGLSRTDIKVGQLVQVDGPVEPNQRLIPGKVRLVRPAEPAPSNNVKSHD